MRFRLVFWLLSLILMSLNIPNIGAKAPATAKIVFGSYRDGNGEIYIMNPDGTALERVVPEAGPKATYPAWSPSGDELIYTQKINNQDQFFKINLVNRASEQLTHIARGFLRSNEMGDWFDPATLPVPLQPQLLTTTWGEVKKR